MDYLYNFHSHTNYCDGRNSAEEMIAEAIKLGVKSYGFSSHAPVPFPNKWSLKKENLDNYINEINVLKEKYKDKIEIYCGLETDYIAKCSGASFFRHIKSLDYLFGSIHYLYENPWTDLFEIDGSLKSFQAGFKQIFKNDPIAITKRFYELTRKMISNDMPDVIAHIDKIKINIRKLVPNLEKQNWYLS